MRIGIYDPYLDTLGGGENVLAVLAEALETIAPESELDIIVHEPPKVSIADLASRFNVALARAHVRVVPVPRRSLWSKAARVDLARRIDIEGRLSKFTRDYELFFNNCIFSTMPSQATASVYVCMFPLPPGHPNIGKQNLRALRRVNTRLRGLYFRRTAETYDQIWANSVYTQGWVRRLWDIEADVVYPPVQVGPEPNHATRDKCILSVGRFFVGEHNKKHRPMIEAFRGLCDNGLTDWEYHLVGGITDAPGTAAYIEELQSRAAGYPITFHFDAPDKELSALQRRARIFWHATGYGEDESSTPEKFEHFGMSTVEAMARGIVPVVIASGGQPEIVSDGVDGYLWTDLGTLAQRTLDLIKDDDRREKMAVAARTRATQFDRAHFAEDVAHRVRQLVSRKRENRPGAMEAG